MKHYLSKALGLSEAGALSIASLQGAGILKQWLRTDEVLDTIAISLSKAAAIEPGMAATLFVPETIRGDGTAAQDVLPDGERVKGTERQQWTLNELYSGPWPIRLPAEVAASAGGVKVVAVTLDQSDRRKVAERVAASLCSHWIDTSELSKTMSKRASDKAAADAEEAERVKRYSELENEYDRFTAQIHGYKQAGRFKDAKQVEEQLEAVKTQMRRCQPRQGYGRATLPSDDPRRERGV